MSLREFDPDFVTTDPDNLKTAGETEFHELLPYFLPPLTPEKQEGHRQRHGWNRAISRGQVIIHHEKELI